MDRPQSEVWPGVGGGGGSGGGGWRQRKQPCEECCEAGERRSDGGVMMGCDVQFPSEAPDQWLPLHPSAAAAAASLENLRRKPGAAPTPHPTPTPHTPLKNQLSHQKVIAKSENPIRHCQWDDVTPPPPSFYVFIYLFTFM